MQPTNIQTHMTAICTALVLVMLTLFSSAPLHAQANPDWTKPFPPFKIVGNLYWVGTTDLAIYLITTKDGHILINSTLESNVPHIQASMEKLGFKFSDIKILLINHAHFDHCAASAMIKTLTGAKYMVMEGDVEVVETGGKADFAYGDTPGNGYPPTRVDRVLHDGDEVRFGDAVLVAHHTPGHTKGCTTWSMKVVDNKKSYDVVIFGGAYVNPGYKLIDNVKYPSIAADYTRTFGLLKSLSCDIFLGAHASYFDMERKYAAATEDGTADPKAVKPSAFVDAEGFRAAIEEKEAEFRAYLAKESQKRDVIDVTTPD